eukprot:scaffold68021_cov33-Attheya_sp.AAC.1
MSCKRDNIHLPKPAAPPGRHLLISLSLEATHNDDIDRHPAYKQVRIKPTRDLFEQQHTPPWQTFLGQTTSVCLRSSRAESSQISQANPILATFAWAVARNKETHTSAASTTTTTTHPRSS